MIFRSKEAVKAVNISNVVCSHFGLTHDDIRGKYRGEPHRTARKLSMLFVRDNTELSLMQMGMVYGRDHATVMHNINAMKSEVMLDKKGNPFNPEIHNIYLEIKDMIDRGATVKTTDYHLDYLQLKIEFDKLVEKVNSFELKYYK